MSLKITINEDIKSKDSIILNIILFFYFAILIRINSIIFIPLIFLFIIYNINDVIKTILKYKLFYAFLIFFSILFLLKNFIVTGCLAYPIYFTCLDLFEWSVGVDQAKFRFNHLSSQSKGYLLYLINQNFINNIFDYYNFRTEKNFISPEIYLKDYNWLSNWWKYEYDINRFLNIIYFFIISLFLIIIFNFNKIKYSNIFENIKKYSFQIILFSLPVITWLFLLPQTRYGGYGIFFSITCFVTIIIFQKIEKLKIVPFIIIFTISISYFGYKNMDRIINNFNELELKKYNNFYDYPSIEKKRFKINNKFGISITERIINTKDILGKPLYCFDFKGFCSSSFRLNCIDKINEINNYIFVIPDKKECASVIDKYLWY